MTSSSQPPAVPEELVEKAADGYQSARGGSWGAQLSAALAAVRDDFRAEGRRECITELEETSARWPASGGQRADADALIRRWRDER